jgi:hypothetical protein
VQAAAIPGAYLIQDSALGCLLSWDQRLGKRSLGVFIHSSPILRSEDTSDWQIKRLSFQSNRTYRWNCLENPEEQFEGRKMTC